MKRFLLLTLLGLLFGLAAGCLEMGIAYMDSLPDPLSAHNHWYDLALIIPDLFSCPGIALTWFIFHPSDGYYGDEWDNRIHIVLLNGLFWMLIIPLFSALTGVAKRAYFKIRLSRAKS